MTLFMTWEISVDWFYETDYDLEFSVDWFYDIVYDLEFSAHTASVTVWFPVENFIIDFSAVGGSFRVELLNLGVLIPAVRYKDHIMGYGIRSVNTLKNTLYSD